MSQQISHKQERDWKLPNLGNIRMLSDVPGRGLAEALPASPWDTRAGTSHSHSTPLFWKVAPKKGRCKI